MSNLRAGLISREIIGQAQGILMEREQITSDQAFDILRRYFPAAQHQAQRRGTEPGRFKGAPIT